MREEAPRKRTIATRDILLKWLYFKNNCDVTMHISQPFREFNPLTSSISLKYKPVK